MIWVESNALAILLQIEFLELGLVAPSLNTKTFFDDGSVMVGFIKDSSASMDFMSDDEKRVCRRKFRKVFQKAHKEYVASKKFTMMHKIANKYEDARVLRKRFDDECAYTNSRLGINCTIDPLDRPQILYERKQMVLQYLHDAMMMRFNSDYEQKEK